MGCKQSERLESAWTKVGGLHLHSRISVNSAETNLPPLILVHGPGVSSRYMIPLAERLASHRRVYALRGERDPVVSQAWVEEVHGLLPESSLVVIAGAAHGVNYNSPEELARVVLDF